jgi:hypothetical protein
MRVGLINRAEAADVHWQDVAELSRRVLVAPPTTP